MGVGNYKNKNWVQSAPFAFLNQNGIAVELQPDREIRRRVKPVLR